MFSGKSRVRRVERRTNLLPRERDIFFKAMNESSRRRIVIGEAHDVRISILTHLFRRQPWAEVVGVARDGLDVVEKVAKLRPDALILNSNLPVVDGFVALRAIRERSISVKAILCSDEDLSGSYARMGADAYFGRADPMEALAGLVWDLIGWEPAQMERRGRRSFLRASPPRVAVGWTSQGMKVFSSWRAARPMEP